MSRPQWNTLCRASIALVATTLAFAAFDPAPAAADPPERQVISGVTRHCEGCDGSGVFNATGPLAGAATNAFFDDRSNRKFSVTHLRMLLDFGGGDTVTLRMTIREGGFDDSDPCRIPFTQNGTWTIESGTGSFTAARGQGHLHNDGVAVNSDPDCGGEAFSTVSWNLQGRSRTS